MNQTIDTTKQFHFLSLEDSVHDFEIISECLIAAGYKLEISRVENEKDFVNILKNKPFDVILADFNLPNFDAFRALELCKTICPDIPFICVSGSIGEIAAIELLKNGAVDYVIKDRLERLPFAVKRAMEEASVVQTKKQIENALLESEAKYRTIFENVQDVFYQTDLNGIVREISPSIKYFTDFESSEILNKPVQNLYYDSNEREMLLKTIIKNGEIRDYEIRILTRKGEIRFASINARLIYDTEGRANHIDGAIRDITERKNNQQVIADREAKLSFAQQIAKMGSWDIDYINQKYNWSKNMYTLLGLEPNGSEISYSDFFNLVHPDDKHLIDEYLQLIIETKNSVTYDFRYIKPDGNTIWVQNNITPVFVNGNLSELHGVNIDITEKKQFEHDLLAAKNKAEASDKLKSAFLNNISHEIRTPLNGILGFAPLIMDPAFSDVEKKGFLDVLNMSSNRLMQTITDIIDISLLTSGTMEVHRSELSLSALFKEIEADYAPKCTAKKLQFFVEHPAEFQQIKIYSDSELLAKVILHLLDNALKFTNSGSITLGAKMLGQKVQLFVNDTGCGVSEEAKVLIFSNFVQENISNTRGHEGNGLGLSIARGIMHLLGSDINFESEKGRGSKFSLKLDVIHVVQSIPEAVPDQFLNSSKKPKVLVAEDDPAGQLFLELLLKADFEILLATNGIEAVDLCKTYADIDLVLMDVKMPVMNGITATMEIKKIRHKLPVIILTAYAELGMREKCIESGCDDYLPKPVEIKDLFAAISKFGFKTRTMLSN